MNELYLACDGDVESLARILQCTPSSIDRIRNGKSEPTLQFEEKIKSIDLVELNPLRDIDKTTEKIATHILNELVENL